MNQTDKAARTAGAVYLALALIAPFSMMYLPAKLIVHGNATATGENIVSHEMLFRIGIVCDLFSSVLFICVGLTLYRLLSSINKSWASAMVAFVLVSAAVSFLNALNNIAALNLFRGGEFLAVIEKPQRDALAYLFIRLHNQGEFINEIFWGLWLFPFGLLVFRSQFLPRFLGIWLIAACFGYLGISLVALLLPNYYDLAFRISQPFIFAELAIILWLLIKGVKVPVGAAATERISSAVDDGVSQGSLTASPAVQR